jgi:DNA-directed RNA polymerase subunit RPC12/RpoP
MSIDATEARWQGFLTKIRERFDEIMQESRVGCAELLRQTGGDPQTVGNAWTGMRMRALALASKISDTWSAQVHDALLDAGASAQRVDANYERGEALRDWMEIEAERTEIAIYSEAIRALLDMAREEQAALRCSQCGAELSLPLTLRGVELPCARCGSLIDVEPGPRARMAEALAHYLWREATWQQWLNRRAAEQACKATRGVELARLQAWERAELDYWSAWLHERAKLMAGAEREFEKDLVGRMRQFYVDCEREAVWTKAGRPTQIDAFLAAHRPAHRG